MLFPPLSLLISVSLIFEGVAQQVPGDDIQIPEGAALVDTGLYGSNLYSLTAPSSSYVDPVLILDLRANNSFGQGFDVGFLLGEQYVENYKALMKSLLGDEWWEPIVERVANAFLDEQWRDFLSKDVPEEFIEEINGMSQGGKSSKGRARNYDIGVLATRGVVMANFPSTLSNFKYILQDEKANPPVNSATGNSIVNDPDFDRVMGIMEKNWRGLHCSNWGAWGSRTESGAVYTGRNLDWVEDTGISKNKLITIHRPPGGIAHATFGWAAVYGAITGMSSAGITVHEANLESNDVSYRGYPWVIRLRDVMSKATNLDEALTIWNSTTNTIGFNHGFGSAADRRAVLLETMHSNTAVFGDNDPREQDLIVDGVQIGDPRVDAVYRTNHGYDDYSVEHYAWNNTGAYENSIWRYSLFPTAFDAYEADKKLITYVEAVNITALVAGRGGKGDDAHAFDCTPPHNGASNVLSISYDPATLVAYAAWENGTGESWTPAACNTYMTINLKEWFELI